MKPAPGVRSSDFYVIKWFNSELFSLPSWKSHTYLKKNDQQYPSWELSKVHNVQRETPGFVKLPIKLLCSRRSTCTPAPPPRRAAFGLPCPGPSLNLPYTLFIYRYTTPSSSSVELSGNIINHNSTQSYQMWYQRGDQRPPSSALRLLRQCFVLAALSRPSEHSFCF